MMMIWWNKKEKSFIPKKHRSLFKIKEVSPLLVFFFFWGLSSFKIFLSLLLKNSRDQWVSEWGALEKHKIYLFFTCKNFHVYSQTNLYSLAVYNSTPPPLYCLSHLSPFSTLQLHPPPLYPSKETTKEEERRKKTQQAKLARLAAQKQVKSSIKKPLVFLPLQH